MARESVRSKVMVHFARRPSKEVTLTDLIKATGAKRNTVLATISGIRSDNNFGRLNFPIEIVQAAQVWCHEPTLEVYEEYRADGTLIEADADVEKLDMFELVGSTKDGDMVVRDGGGVLYKAMLL